MSFHLYKTTSPREAVTKNFKTSYTWMTYKANEPLDVLKPIITVEESANVADFVSFNYARIDELNRYYFVDKIEVVANGLYRYYLSVDVLTTYADIIYQQKAVIKRQQFLYDLYLNDGSLRVENYPLIQTLKFSNSPLANSWHYLLAVAGGGN